MNKVTFDEELVNRMIDEAISKRQWVGLTDEEIQYCVELKNPEAIAEEVEAKLKEKNT